MKNTIAHVSNDFHSLSKNSVWYRALTLQERTASLHLVNTNDRCVDWDTAEKKLCQWKEERAFKHSGDFERRLALFHITERDLLFLLGESMDSLQTRTGLPDWLIELDRAFEMAEERVDEVETLGHASDTSTVSFLDTIQILINYGKNQLENGVKKIEQTGTSIPFDAQTAVNIFFPNLVPLLMNEITRTLALELNVSRLLELLEGDTPEERFRYFVRNVEQKSGLLSIFEEYPVLARQLMVTINRWVRYSLEFLSHLCSDWERICETFEGATLCDKLVAVQGGAGDVHRGGRSVLKVTFTSGLRLIYKPKSLSVDLHFQELLNWLNAQGTHLPFLTITLLDCGTYGWSEYIDAKECRSLEEVAHFYERQGGYLALLYALEATDFHYENLIAAGEHPVLIDLEALFHPRVANEEILQSEKLATETIRHSVMRIGLLPQRIHGKDIYSSLDISGLGGRDGQRTLRPVPLWQLAGTDEMKLVREYGTLDGQDNRPRIHGRDVDLLEYGDAIVKGFVNIYHLLIEKREALISGPLACFATDETRYIARPTAFYFQLLRESFHPDVLRDALDRDRFFDHLWLDIAKQPHLSRLIRAEYADLLDGDIPMFTMSPTTRHLYTSSGECIADFFDESSLEATQKNIRSFSENDCVRQCWFIRASLATLLLGKGQIAWKNASITTSTQKATRERLIDAACAVGDRLCEIALRNEHGASWVSISLIQEQSWMLVPTGPELYNGTAGIIFFLSYLGTITGNAKYTAVAKEALINMHYHLKSIQADHINIGGFDGWGAIIYLLSHLSVLWHDEQYLEEAKEYVALLSDLIEQDKSFDILDGAAGCILSLKSLYQVAPSFAILDAAIRCGDHLLSNATTMDDGIGWLHITNPEQPLTGFSHGTAGIALSLVTLAQWSQEKRFYHGAEKAMLYDRSIFSSEMQNWPDLRKKMNGSKEAETLQDEDDRYMIAWCHGAAGIGLARLASLAYIDDDAIRNEIHVAINQIEKLGFSTNHSLCHGSLGNIETIVLAANVLSEKRYDDLVEKASSLILDSIDIDGWITGVPLGVESPGLMSGIAGIGYELLRLAEPEKVPSVLLLSPPLQGHSKNA